MTVTRDRIYQTSDLTGAARREFIDDARRGRAYLRTPEGESLVMLRAADLDLLASLRDSFVAYIMLDSALSRTREERRTSDFGDWAFIEEMEEEDIRLFRDEMNSVLAKATSGQDLSIVERTLHEWRMSARAWSNPVTRAAIMGNAEEDDWVEVGPPDLAD